MLSKAERNGRRSPVLLFSVSLLRAGCHTGVQRSRRRGLRLSHALHESRILQPGDSFTPPPMSTNTYVRHPHLSMFLSVSPQCGFTRSFHEFYDVLYTQCIHNVLHIGFVELSCFQWRETFPLRGSSFPGRLVMDCWELAHLPPLPPPGLKTQMLNISMQL